MSETETFEALLKRYRGLIFTVCRRYERRGITAEDLVQEATIAIWRARDRITSVSTMGQAALVWKVARNAAIDMLRKTPETESLPEGYESVSTDRSLMQELYDQIALLDEPDKTIVNMQLEGYSYEEIADKTQMTVKNVSVRLVRIKDKLRTKFQANPLI